MLEGKILRRNNLPIGTRDLCSALLSLSLPVFDVISCASTLFAISPVTFCQTVILSLDEGEAGGRG